MRPSMSPPEGESWIEKRRAVFVQRGKAVSRNPARVARVVPNSRAWRCHAPAPDGVSVTNARGSHTTAPSMASVAAMRKNSRKGSRLPLTPEAAWLAGNCAIYSEIIGLLLAPAQTGRSEACHSSIYLAGFGQADAEAMVDGGFDSLTASSSGTRLRCRACLGQQAA